MKEKKQSENRKLIKYAAVIAALTVLITVLFLCGKQSRAESKKQEVNNTDQTNGVEMLGDISEIMENLEQMDGVLEENQLSLKKINESHKDMEVLFGELNSAIEQVENQFRNYENISKTEKTELDIELESIAEELKNIRSDISTAQEENVSLLNRIKTEGAENQEEIEKRLGNLKQILTENRELLSALTGKISIQLEQLQKGQDDKHEEVIKLLVEAEERLTDITENAIITLLENTDEQFALMQAQIADYVNELSERLQSIRGQIADTKGGLELLLLNMENGQNMNHEEIMEAFTAIQKSMHQIVADVDNAHAEMKELILKLQETTAAGQKELLSVLDELERGMQENGSENLNQILASMDEMAVQYSSQFDILKQEMNQNVTDMGNSVDNRLNLLETSIGNQHTNLTNIINQGDTGLREYLSGAFGGMERKLDSVFQSVSNGKRKMASALLTKGVNCKGDATFQEIVDAILSIPQTLVIGETHMPGTITYDYHYHIDGSGTVQHVETLAQRGGCYNRPVHHVHSGDSGNGGGCYTNPVMHTHSEGCYKVTRRVREVTSYWFTGEGTGHSCCSSAHGQNRARYRYVDKVYEDGILISTEEGEGDLGYCCNMCVAGKAYGKAYDSKESSVICGFSEGLNGYELGCGKTGSTVEAYRTGCGLGDGQITGAHITYAKNVMFMTEIIPEIVTKEAVQEEESMIMEEESQEEQCHENMEEPAIEQEELVTGEEIMPEETEQEEVIQEEAEQEEIIQQETVTDMTEESQYILFS